MDTDEFRRLRAEGKHLVVAHSDMEVGQHKRGKGASQPGPRRSTTEYLMGAQPAAKWLGVPVFTLYSWAQTGKIPHVKLERRVMFCKEDLRRWVDAHRRVAREG